MSMMARYVQVSPSELRRLIADPEPIAELFVEPASRGSFDKLLSDPRVQQRLQSMGPKLLAGAMAGLKPEQRDTLMKRLAAIGISEEAFAAGTGGAALGKLMAERTQGPAKASAQPAATSPSIDLGKNWHGIHFILCGSAEPGNAPLSQVVMGGVEIGDDDHGYGPARYFDVDRTAAIAAVLADPGLEPAMRARFDPARMTTAGIYPGGWDQRGELDHLIETFRELRQFFAAASQSQMAIITCLV